MLDVGLTKLLHFSALSAKRLGRRRVLPLHIGQLCKLRRMRS